ncbi:MAG: hypothetical protein SOI38_04870 [Eggerthellaceae bacterium]
MGYETQIAQIQRGHIALAVCAALYLIWWVIFFRPGAASTPGAVKGLGVAFIIGAAVAGLYAVFQICGSLGGLSLSVPVFGIVCMGVVGYFILLAITLGACHRPVTTELALIVGWVVLEAIALDALSAAGALGSGAVAALGIVVAIAAVAALLCYVLYYGLPLPASFYDGAGPLAVVLVVSIVFALVGR